MPIEQPPPPEIAGWWYWCAGLAGAIVSLAHMHGVSRWTRAGAVAAGTLTAMFVGPYAADLLGANPRGAAAIHFGLGLGGLMVTAAAMGLFRAVRDNPAATLAEVLRRLGGGATGGPPAAK